MAPRRSVRETASRRLLTTLPVLCRLDDVADSDAPAFVDLAAPLGATIVNPTMFTTYPSAFLLADAADRSRPTRPPRVWIRDTLAGALWPFSTTRFSEAIVHSLVAPRIEGLSPSEITVLRKATLLVRPEELARRELAGKAQVGSAADQFRQYGWCVLKDIVHPAHLAALARRYDALVQSGRWRLGDRQVSRRYSRADDEAASFFHRQFTESEIRPGDGIPSAEMNRSIRTSDLFPILNDAGENVADLVAGDVLDGIGGIDDNSHGIRADHVTV